MAAFSQNNAADSLYLDSIYRHLELEEFTISARVKEKDIIIPQTLSGVQLKKMNALSVADAIRYFSGVQIKDYGGVGGIKTVNIRSMGTNHMGVYYNGIQLGNAQNGQIDLGKYSLENIEEIQLYNGQKSDIWQSAREFGAAGSIYLTTRRPRFAEGKTVNVKAQMRAGSFALIDPSLLLDVKLSETMYAMKPELFQTYADKIIQNCSRVIVGKEEVIRQIIVSFLCGGHVLLEDVPGTGKTMLLRSFAKSIGGDFKRIQFTPDLLPSDLTGINFYNPKTAEFEFRPGPLFSGMILADEINRATPRTQSALLESMEERQITVDGTTYPMASPFMVMATQNPIESYGTFPLPEAQVDRFFMRLSMGYMTREQELSVIARRSTLTLVEELEQVVTAEETSQLQSQLHEVSVSADVAGYIMDIITATRETGELVTGVSTRGAIALYKAAQVTAAMAGRSFVIPEDVVKEAVPVLAHRVTASSGSRQDAEEYLKRKIKEVAVPLETIDA